MNDSVNDFDLFSGVATSNFQETAMGLVFNCFVGTLPFAHHPHCEELRFSPHKNDLTRPPEKNYTLVV